jgi:uncharacterized phage infection (PIP) family protein YhgE
MKMKKYILMMSAVIPGIIALTSCTELPQQQIDEAQVAIENAKTIGAETYAAENYFALEDSMKNAMSIITEQDGKFFKKYDVAIEKLSAVTSQAATVSAGVETKKQEIKTNVTNMIIEVKSLIAESKQLITEAPKGKEGASALVAMKGELDAVEVALTECSTLLEQSQLQPSLEKATVAKTKAVELNTELKEIMSKYKSAKK